MATHHSALTSISDFIYLSEITTMWQLDGIVYKLKPRPFHKFIYLSGAVHTRVEVRRMDSEMSGLVERPWLQLMCCAICLPHGCNFR